MHRTKLLRNKVNCILPGLAAALVVVVSPALAGEPSATPAPTSAAPTPAPTPPAPASAAPTIAPAPTAPVAASAAPPIAPAPTTPAPAAPPASPPSGAPVHCPERACPTPEWRGVIGAGAFLGLEVGSEPAPGFWLAGEARSERWSLGVEARGVFPASAYRLRDGVSTVDLALYSGVAVPCVRWRWLAGCALVEVGGLWVAGPGAGGDPAAPFVGLGVRARADFPLLAGFEVRISGDGIGHVLGLAVQGDDTSGPAGEADPTPFTFDAPRRVSAYLAVGLAKVF